MCTVPLGGDIIEVLAPINPTTPSTASRLLRKRGRDGGYMLIMQACNAAARTQLIEERRLATVVFQQRASDGSGGSVERAQFNPKGIPGLFTLVLNLVSSGSVRNMGLISGRLRNRKHNARARHL